MDVQANCGWLLTQLYENNSETVFLLQSNTCPLPALNLFKRMKDEKRTLLQETALSIQHVISLHSFLSGRNLAFVTIMNSSETHFPIWGGCEVRNLDHTVWWTDTEQPLGCGQPRVASYFLIVNSLFPLNKSKSTWAGGFRLSLTMPGHCKLGGELDPLVAHLTFWLLLVNNILRRLPTTCNLVTLTSLL